MSLYQGKVLQLVAIEKESETSYLRIKLSLEQEVERLWEIDSMTAEHLQSICEFDGLHKYRISLHTTFDKNKKQYQCLITKTFRNHSHRFYFTCSVDYKNELEAIKDSQRIHDLDQLPFLSMNLRTHKQNSIANDKVKTRIKPSLKWISIVILSLIFVMAFEYSNKLYLYYSSFNTSTIAHAKVKTTIVNLESKRSVVKPLSKLIRDDPNQSSLPHIKLDDSLTYSIPKGDVSLTFDDGPSQYTEKIVDILEKYKVGGTFFFIGINAKKHPDYVRYVHSHGYTIGNHSMRHLEMSKLPYESQEKELLQASKTIEGITRDKITLFRPPYESYNEQTMDVLNDSHYKMVLWNSDPKDWKTRNPEKIFDYVRHSKASGSIILLHESQSVIDALPKIIKYLQEKNLNVVSLQ